MVQIGRAYHEMTEYTKAAKHFRIARQRCPHVVDGLEIFSTVLWQLKREAELAHLAHEAIALDRLSPQAWCVAGNCLSLQRDHEGAIEFLKRYGDNKNKNSSRVTQRLF